MELPMDLSEAKRRSTSHAEQGTRDELIRLVDRYERPLFNFLLMLLGDWDAAQDSAQDAFLRAYEHLRQGRQISAAWLYRVARNRAIDELRHRRRVSPDLEKLETMEERELDEIAGPVQRALAQLSPGDRELLYLFDIDGFEAREIGEMLGITQNAVHVRVFRARERFRKIYLPKGETT